LIGIRIVKDMSGSVFEFSAGDPAFGGDGSIQILCDPRSHLLGGNTSQTFPDRFCRRGSQQRSEAGQQAGKAASAVLAFQVFEQTE
jgi:hypothetical protein